MTDVFISYKKEDVDRVRPVAEALAEAGYDVWWDHRIPPGRTYRDVIGAALESAKCVIVVWSERAVGAQWVLDEADEGKKRGVLLPLLIDDVMPPFGFRQIEAARLVGWSGDTAHPEWTHALETVAHFVGRRPGEAPPVSITAPSSAGGAGAPVAMTLATPGAAASVAAAPAAGKSGKSGGGAGMIIGALVLLAALLGGGYFAVSSGLLGATEPEPPTLDADTDTDAPASDVETVYLANISVHISDERQRRDAERLVSILRDAGHTVSGAQNVGAESPRDMGVVRFFSEESRPYAEAVLGALEGQELPAFDDRINRNFPGEPVDRIEVFFQYMEPDPFAGLSGQNVMSISLADGRTIAHMRDGFWGVFGENGLPAELYELTGRAENGFWLRDVRSGQQYAIDLPSQSFKIRQEDGLYVPFADLRMASTEGVAAPSLVGVTEIVLPENLRLQRISGGAQPVWEEILPSGQRQYQWTQVALDGHFMELSDNAGRGGRMRVDLIQGMVYLYFPEWGQFQPQWPVEGVERG